MTGSQRAAEKGGTSESGKFPARRRRLESASGMVAVVGEFGARLHELWVPDRAGNRVDVTLGFDHDEDDRAHVGSYIGAILGRVSGRVRGARFRLDGREVVLAANEPPNHLHGGTVRSFDRVTWESRPERIGGHPAVRFDYRSPDLEEGYPGAVHATATYVAVDNDLWLMFSAVTDRRTPISLTSHAFWNLAGHGSATVLDHELLIDGSLVAAADGGLVPTGASESVIGTALDFRTARPLRTRIAELDDLPTAGYDHCYVLDGEAGLLRRAALLSHPPSGRTMELLTTEPALQLYTANRLPPMVGKGGQSYGPRSAICLEPQIVPDAVNRPGDGFVFLDPGQTYRHTTVFRFAVDPTPGGR